MQIVDLHTHPLLNAMLLGRDVGLRQRPPRRYNPLRQQVDLARAYESDVAALGFVSYLPWAFPWPSAWEATLASFARFRRIVTDNSDRALHLRSREDLDEAEASSRIAAFLCIEGGHVLEEDMTRLDWCREAGVLYITLVHFRSNQIGPSCHQDPKGRKHLTAFGRRLIPEMERRHILPDVAHLAEGAFWEVIELAEGPVLYTHGGAKALCPVNRNLTDEQIRAIGASGGLFGLITFRTFLRTARCRDGIELILHHAEHVLELIGEDHLAIGSDLDGYILPVSPIRDITALPLLVEAMVERFGERVARKIAGENALELFRRTLPCRSTASTKGETTA